MTGSPPESIESLIARSSFGDPEALRARAATPAETAQAIYQRVRAAPCCDLHGRHCEPPGDLCCGACTEAAHGMGDASRGHHAADGSPCSSPELSEPLTGTEYVACRFVSGSPPETIAEKMAGWHRREDLTATARPSWLPGGTVGHLLSARVAKTGRLEQREDGATAEVWELRW